VAVWPVFHAVCVYVASFLKDAERPLSSLLPTARHLTRAEKNEAELKRQKKLDAWMDGIKQQMKGNFLFSNFTTWNF